MNTENRLRELVQETLADNHQIDTVRFIDQLFLIAAEAGTIQCRLLDGCKFCFQINNQPAWEIELGRAKSKLRALCARLSVVCAEKTGQNVSIFGDDVSLEICAGHQATAETVGCLTKMHVRFKNTMHEQEFVIETI